MSEKKDSRILEVDGREIEISNPDKIIFPQAEISKAELVEYYSRAAEHMLPYLQERPISMQRYPDGIGEAGFYQKELPEHFPEWIDSVEVELKEGGSQLQVVCSNRATLVYLADQACLTPHVWLSRAGDLDRPDRMIFDLDPPAEDPGEAFRAVRQAARRLQDLLGALDLNPLLMLTGSTGLHVVVPLEPEAEFDTVREFTQDVASMLVEAYPEELTVARRKERRRGRVFIDTARNAYAQTAVPPYAVRARPGAPVAVPLDWDELSASDLSPGSYSIQNIFRRLAQKVDPWADFIDRAAPLSRAVKRLDEAAGLDKLES